MKKFFLLAVIFIFGTNSSWSQGLVPNGGDPISMEFLEIARTLPGIIAAKGEEQFPGITISAMLSAVNDPQWKIQLGKDLNIGGVRKAAITYSDQKMTVIDEDMWNYLTFLPEAKKRKRALVLHEVLVLLKIEFTNDYHLSSRLYGPEILKEPYENEILRDPSNGEKKIQAVGRLLPAGTSSQGIFAFIYADQTVRYTYCENRYEPDTCRSLGGANQYYKIEQIQSLYSKNDLSRKRWMKVGYASVAIITIGGGTIMSVITGMPLLSYPFAYIVSGVPLIWAMTKAKNKGAVLPATDSQMTSGKTITGTYDLKYIAAKLDEALLKLSGANKNPAIQKP